MQNEYESTERCVEGPASISPEMQRLVPRAAEVLLLLPAVMLIRSIVALLIVGGQSAIGFVPYQQRGRWSTSRRKQCCRRGLAIMMGAKRVHFGDKGLDKLVEGINIVGEAVRVTLGPKGRNVVLHRDAKASPQIVNDGVTIARDIELPDPERNIGVRLIQEVAKKSDRRAGDGTTTSILLTQALVNQGLKYVKAGVSPTSLRAGISKAAQMVAEKIPSLASQVEDVDDVVKVAVVATSGDVAMANTIAAAFERVNLDAKLGGATLLEDGNAADDVLDVTDGMRLDRSGWDSPYFVTDTDRLVCELKKPRVLVTNYALMYAYQLLPILEEVAKTREPLLIVAEETKDEALSLLVVNKLRGLLDVCAVRAPFAGNRRKQFLQDIALATGATLVDQDLGMMLQTMTPDMLGTAHAATTTRHHTTILTDPQFQKQTQAHVARLKTELQSSDNIYDEQKLQYRVAALSGGVASIKVGAATETELKDRKLRYEDAINSVKSALEHGVLPGGGSALVYLAETMRDDMLAALPDPQERAGADIVLRAMAEPMGQVAKNAGMNGATVVEKVRARREWGFGLNAATGQYCNLVEQGVLDSASVVLNALTTAASVAGLVLTTECVITEAPK